MLNKNTQGMTAEQLANGTPSDKLLILKAFYKGDKAIVSPAKDINRRYLGIKENIPEIKKLEMGYVPSPESRVRIYDGIEIDLNEEHWAKDWEWMQHCAEISPDFATGQATPGAYFYIFRPGIEEARNVLDVEKEVKLLNYVLNDSAENLYNRAMILGVNMNHEPISVVKDYMLGLVRTEPHKIQKVYESKTFSLELLLMHAMQKGSIAKKNGVYTFGGILLGVNKNAVIAFFANPKNVSTTRAVEAVTYGRKELVENPLDGEAVADDNEFEDVPEETKIVDNKTTAAASKAKKVVRKK